MKAVGMTALQVKDCPVALYERLRACAERENRSISQQIVTILEEYLGMRASGRMINEPRAAASRFGYAGERRETDYLARRREVFDRIRELPPIPVSEIAPRVDAILARIREEEAR